MRFGVRSLLAAIILGVMSVAVAAPALAVAWKSSTDPLYVYEDGVKQGKAYGNFYNNSTSAMSTSYQYDMKPGGNNVRVETDFYFWRYSPGSCGSTGQTTCYVWDISKQTVESNTATWVKDSRARNLRADSDKARGAINICEIQSWSNDPCSAHVLPSFSY